MIFRRHINGALLNPNVTGTFWYHSHLSTQYCDGLRGALVLYDPDDPHKDLFDVDDGKLPQLWYMNYVIADNCIREHCHYPS